MLRYVLLICLCNFITIQTVPVLHCVSCANAACPPEPVCQLDRVPCGCCNVCTLQAGEACHGFSASCGANLKCLTPGGEFDERPPWFSILTGFCVPTYLTPPLATLAPPLPQIG